MARSCSGWSAANYFSRSDTAVDTEPLTMTCWVRTGTVSSGASRALVHWGNNGTTGEYLLFLNSTGVVQAQKQDDAGSVTSACSSGVTVTANQWTFAAVRFVSDTSRFCYADGTMGTEVTVSCSDPTCDFQSIGVRRRSSGITLPHNGNIAMVTVWQGTNGDLTQAELDGLYRGRHPSQVRPESIVRAWWMPVAGSRLTDFSGNGSNLTLTGTVTDNSFGPPVEPWPYFYVPFLGIGTPFLGDEGTTVAVSTGTLELGGVVPTITTTANVSVETATGKLELLGGTATIAVSDHITVSLDVGKLELSGLAPTVAAGGSQTATTSTGVLELLGLAPTIAATAHITVNPTTGVLEINGQVPVILAGQSVATATGVLELAGLAPTIATTANVTVQLDVGKLELLGIVPTIVADADATVSLGTGTLILTGLTPLLAVSGIGQTFLRMSDAVSTALTMSDAAVTSLSLNDNAVTTLTLSDAA